MVFDGEPITVRCSASQCVAVCCSSLQCVAVRCSVLQCIAVWCSMLLLVRVTLLWSSSAHISIVRCCVLQGVCCNMLSFAHHIDMVFVDESARVPQLALISLSCSVSPCVGSSLQCVTVCCSVVQYKTERCSVLR